MNQSGQVAQLVEQGTENPRVGGLIPSLATLKTSAFVGVLLLLAGCQSDSCDLLCTRTTTMLERCMPTWTPVEWEMLDAAGPASFENACLSRWSQVRSSLESRELEVALDQCDEALVAIDDMNEEGTTCDQLRALYIQ